MENKNYFGNYKLSQGTFDKLKQAEEFLERDANPANPAWSIIKPKQAIRVDEPEDEPPPIQEDVAEIAENEESSGVISTQFYYSQQEKPPEPPKNVEPSATCWLDIAESLSESLENTNGTLSLDHLAKLPEAEVNNVIEYLNTKLSLKGSYNLCRSVCAMDTDRSVVFIKMICSKLLLGKIIDLQEPSKLMSSLIPELVDKFPEDVREFLFVPMLNAEIADTTAILTIISSFSAQNKNDLSNFLTSVHELKQWHVNILSQLMTVKLQDSAMREKLLKLLSKKASTYSKEKNYGKFILSFLKLNASFTEDEKMSVCEIVAVNETIFKKPMESLLNNMFFYDDLWHIS